jgi:hypothetical protein
MITLNSAWKRDLRVAGGEKRRPVTYIADAFGVPVFA